MQQKIVLLTFCIYVKANFTLIFSSCCVHALLAFYLLSLCRHSACFCPMHPRIPVTMLCLHEPEALAEPILNPPPPRCVPRVREYLTRQDRLELKRYEKRIERLEKTIEDMCSAIIHADDVALLEREGSKIGAIYMDSNLSKSRNPRILRRTLMETILKHQFVVRPPENHWHS